MKQEEIKQDIENRNTKGYFHGYQEWYEDSILTLRGMYKNDLEVVYEEFHLVKQTTFYIR